MSSVGLVLREEEVRAPAGTGLRRHSRPRFRILRLWDALLEGQITRAGVFLVLRQGVILVLNVVSTVSVARWLGPEVVGRFAVLAFITMGMLGPFGDLGLKAALIRKPGSLTMPELATAQRVILGFTLLLIALIGVLLPLIFRIVHLGPEHYLPAAVLLLLLALRNFRLVPLAMLERAMRFKAVSFIEALETLIYTVLVATLAYAHYGVWAFVTAMACRDLVGAVILAAVARPPWRPFDLQSIRPHVRFTLLCQGGSVANTITGAFPAVVIGGLIGKAEVGYVDWASRVSMYPLFICYALARMYLPAFSSIRHDPARLRSLVEKAIRVNASIVLPVCAVLITLSGPLTVFIFTSQWSPAQPMLYSYCLAAALSAIALPLTELFYSLDDAAFNLRLSLLWTGLTWTVGWLAVRSYGFSGFVVFYAALQATWAWAFVHAREPRGLKIFASLREPLLFAVFLVAANLTVCTFFPVTSITKLASVLCAEGLLGIAFSFGTLLKIKRTDDGVA